MNETDLYQPVKELLQSMGYEVKSEVKHCDVMACKDDNYLVIELKLSINLTLILQAVERQRMMECVYIAVPQKCLTKKNRVKSILHLCSRLEIGIIGVNKSSAKVMLDCNYMDRKTALSRKKKNKIKLIEEFKLLQGDNNIGGMNGKKIHTVYKQKCIYIAELLSKGENSAAELKRQGADPYANNILRQNYYGWFERTEKRGIYALSDNGKKYIEDYKKIVQ